MIHSPEKSGFVWAAAGSDNAPAMTATSVRRIASLSFLQIVIFEEFRPERLGRDGNVRPSLGREVHQIPIRPHCVDMIPAQFRRPEMKDPTVAAREDMHHRQLHVVSLSLALVVGLKPGLESG